MEVSNNLNIKSKNIKRWIKLGIDRKKGKSLINNLSYKQYNNFQIKV